MIIFSYLKDKLQKYNTPLYNDSLWAIIGNVSLRGLGLLGSIFVARFLGSEVFGEYGAVKNTIVSIAIFSTYGLGYTSTKYVADYYNKKGVDVKDFIKIAFNITLILSLFIAALTLIFAQYIANVVLNQPSLVDLIRYVAIWVVFNALTTLQIGFLSGFGQYKAMAKINTIVGLVTFGFSVIFTWLYSLNGAIFALIISQIINWILYYRLLQKQLGKVDNLSTENYKKVTYKEVLQFSFPIALQEMVYSITSWLSTIIIIKYSTYSQLGLHTASAQWSAIVLFIPVVLRNVVLSNLSKQDDHKNHKNIVKKMVIINVLCTILPTIVIALFSGLITNLYGKSFESLKGILFVALFSSVFISINSVYSQAFMSIGKNWIMFFLRLLRDSTILVLTIYLLVNYKSVLGGAMALNFAILTSNVIFMILMMYIYNNFKQ